MGRRYHFSLEIGYNWDRPFFQRGSIIKNNVFAAIQDVNETLALTNEPGQLVNMSLDTLSQVTGIECCWIQSSEGERRPRLAAELGFTPEMRAELAAMDLDRGFTGEIIGLGHRVVIPDLSADGAFGLGSFRRAGFRWLIAVPLMTYRVHGILGVASRRKNLLRKETPELMMVVGGLIGAALSKSRLSQKPTMLEKPVPEADPARIEPGRLERPFEVHRRRMQEFRGSHGPRR